MNKEAADSVPVYFERAARVGLRSFVIGVPAFDRPHPAPTGNAAAAPASERLWPIQLLRGVAATMIVIGHSQSAVERLGIAQGRAYHRWQGLPWGASVDLFFVISGFIMVYASRRLFARPGATVDFLSRRLTRVVPLYWCCTTAILAILAVAAARGGDPLPDAAHLAASYLFLPMRTANGIFPLFDLGWTLNYEMAFYASFALFVWLPRGRAVVAVATCALAAALVGSIVRFEAAPLFFWTRPIVVDFAMGVVVGSLCCDGVVLGRRTRIAAVLVGTAIFCADPFSLFEGPLGTTTSNGWPRVLASGIPVALVMAGVSLGPQPALPAWLRPGVKIGNASYSLYLWHPFVLIAMEKLVQKAPFARALPLPLLVVLTVAAALATSILSFRWIELPLTAGADRLLEDGRDAWRRRHAS